MGYTNYEVLPIPGTPGAPGTEAGDGSVLYWDSATNRILGDPGLVFDDSANTLTLGSGSKLYLPVGTSGAPSLAFTDNTSTGMFATSGGVGSGQIEWSANGSRRMYLNTGGLTVNTGLVLENGQLLLPDGSSAAPSLSFSSQDTTGLYRLSTNILAATTGGIATMAWVVENVRIRSDGGYTWVPGTNLGVGHDLALVRDAAGVLAQRNAGNAQAFRVYNTYTSDTNYERLACYWSGSFAFVETQKGSGGGGGRGLILNAAGNSLYLRAGGGSGWSLSSTAPNLVPEVDSSLDLGTSSLRVRTGYFGGTAASIGLVVKAHASQTANLQEWQNSSGTPLAYVDKDGRGSLVKGLLVGPAATGPWIFGFAGEALTSPSATGENLGVYTYTVGANNIGFSVAGANVTADSGNYSTAEIYRTFAPTSGTGTYKHLYLVPTINQTGGASGITWGLYINPALTSAADFRAIEVAAGKSIFGDDLYFSGAGSGLAYGSADGDEIAWAQTSMTQNTWYAISDADIVDGHGGLNLITHDGSGKLTVTKAGRYLVNYGVSIEMNGANNHAKVGLLVNGSIITDGKHHLHFVTANAEMAVAGSAIVSLAANGYVEIGVMNPDAGTPNVLVDHTCLTMVQVGG